MNYQETCIEYARALLGQLTAHDESIQNQLAATASFHAASLSNKSRQAIERSVAVQARLIDFLTAGGINS